MSTGASTLGWVTCTEADTYAIDSLRWSDWSALLSEDAKRPYLMTAYRLISASPAWALPETATDRMKSAQIEMALFLLTSGDSASKRATLQAQGVSSFRVGDFSETFDPVQSRGNSVGSNAIFPAEVLDLLSIYSAPPITARVQRDYGAL
jgi:hypothetical protein